MSYYQKLVATFATNKSVLLLTAVFFTLTSMAPRRANFSGNWKLNESKSVRGNSLCIYDSGDRMRSDSMEIAGHADFLTIDVVSSSSDGALVTRREKLTFDGKESEVTLIRRGKTFTVKWSDDGKTMTVNSIVYLDINGEKQEFKVTEVWKLIDDGKSISLQANAKSTFFGERAWTFVYDKAS
jgi:hypothetical protein